MEQKIRHLSCACGKVRFEAVGEPIVTAVCYCDDCQAGGRLVEALPNGKPALQEDCGASYLTFRDDRFECSEGEHLLKGYKLRENSPTQRFVATCCNSVVYLKYKRGHWVSTWRNRYEEDRLPPIEMRTNIRYRESADPLNDDVPNYKRFPLSLFGKLITSRINMMLGR